MSRVPAKLRRRGTMLRAKAFCVPAGKISLTARLGRLGAVDVEVARAIGCDAFRRLAGALGMMEIDS